ncbi:MAG: response regulator transcription factor [Anaerolineales bacterium]|nr:response regulator transcription factor [Anaerolineales bacterium]MCB8983603.1 response regulator transcription factor [Ardenticatenaceae bacterium]
MRILIVDDERPSRGELRYILQQLAATAEIVEATNGQEALTAVARESLDVVFLDINMPGLNGLAAAAAIAERPDPPLIVFATAYDAHAVRAFELAALDYVVKPFDERRLAQTMVRIREALAAREKRDAQQSAVRAYLAGAAAPTLHKLWGERDEETAVLVDYADILWVEALDKKVFIHTAAGATLRVQFTMQELEGRLAVASFTRIHKSYLVNLNHVAEIGKGFSGTYLVVMADAARSRLPMSRQYGRQLRDNLRGPG